MGDSTTSRARDSAPPLPLIFADSGWDRLNNQSSRLRTAAIPLFDTSASVPHREMASELGTSSRTKQSPFAFPPNTVKHAASSTPLSPTFFRSAASSASPTAKLPQQAQPRAQRGQEKLRT